MKKSTALFTPLRLAGSLGLLYDEKLTTTQEKMT